MATYYESAYKQLLMGVSQQDPKDRLDGQLTEQVNMTSDPVYGLRRRSPLRYEGTMDAYFSPDRVAIYNTHLSGELIWVVVNIESGAIACYDVHGTVKWTHGDPYLKASSQAAIRFAVLNGFIYIANVEQAPREELDPAVAIYPNPAFRGWWIPQSAAFQAKYHLRIRMTDTGEVFESEYETPANDGTTAAVVKSSISYICNQLASQFKLPGIIVTGTPTSIIIKTGNRPFTVATNSPRSLVRTSGASRVRLVEDLPAHLDDAQMDRYIMRVGTGTKDSYYRYDYTQQIWLEDAAFGDGVRPTNMPARMSPNSDGSWNYDHPAHQRRPAGSASTNPSLAFLSNGITGIGVFQGRLVLLAGEFVCMSATNNPLLWYRSTVDGLDASDPVEAAGSDSSTAPFVHATLFNKDLILYGTDVQAIIPGTQPVTPSNVVVGIMSRYKCTLYAAPTTTGKSQYVGAIRGDGYAAVWEVVPSDYVTSQIMANDVTNHIPAYTPGTVRWISASTTSSIVAVGFTVDIDTMLIEEYLIQGGEKKQSAWHKWKFGKNILHAVFEQDVLYLVIHDPYVGGTHIGSLDLRRGAKEGRVAVPRLDFHKTFKVDQYGNVVMELKYYKLLEGNMWAFKLTGAGRINKLYPIETIRVDGLNVLIRITGSTPGDEFVLGSKYESAFTLTPPKMLDSNGAAITMYKATIQHYHINWAYSGNLTYSFKDTFRKVIQGSVTPAFSRSDPLDENWMPVPSVATNIPVRLDMASINARFSTWDVYDLCPTLVEYGYRYNQVRGRRV